MVRALERWLTTVRNVSVKRNSNISIALLNYIMLSIRYIKHVSEQKLSIEIDIVLHITLWLTVSSRGAMMTGCGSSVETI